MGAQINGSCHMITPEEYDKLVGSFVTTPVPEKPVQAPAHKKQSIYVMDTDYTQFCDSVFYIKASVHPVGCPDSGKSAVIDIES